MPGGSRKGIPNKPKRILLQRLREEFPNYEPILETARAAHRLSAMAVEAETASAKAQGEDIAPLRAEAANLWKDAGTQHEKVAQYVTPKLKAVEVTGKDGGPIDHSITVEFVGEGSNSKGI